MAGKPWGASVTPGGRMSAPLSPGAIKQLCTGEGLPALAFSSACARSNLSSWVFFEHT
jgi:hypothetical protein